VSAIRAEERELALSRRKTIGLVAGLALAWRDADEADAAEEGFQTYMRGNRTRFETSISSAIRPYTLDIPVDWREEMVSLNDGKLYGVDLRFKSKDGSAQLAMSALPYANRDSIDQAGPPDEALDTFIELVGAFWSANGFGDPDRAVGSTSAVRSDGVGKYYIYELQSPKCLIAATATDGMLYILNVSASSRQWKKSEETLKTILNSFNVPPPPPVSSIFP